MRKMDQMANVFFEGKKEKLNNLEKDNFVEQLLMANKLKTKENYLIDFEQKLVERKLGAANGLYVEVRVREKEMNYEKENI